MQILPASLGIPLLHLFSQLSLLEQILLESTIEKSLFSPTKLEAVAIVVRSKNKRLQFYFILFFIFHFLFLELWG